MVFFKTWCFLRKTQCFLKLSQNVGVFEKKWCIYHISLLLEGILNFLDGRFDCLDITILKDEVFFLFHFWYYTGFFCCFELPIEMPVKLLIYWIIHISF